MYRNEIIKSGDESKVQQLRKEYDVKPKIFELYGDAWTAIQGGKDGIINIVMVVNVIPNSFVLSYLAALRKVLSEIFKHSPDKEVAIDILFMENIVLGEDGAWKREFELHYKDIVNEIEKEQIKKTLVELKCTEFKSFFNMVLHSFDDEYIKKAVRRTKKVKVNFNSLSKEREKLCINKDEQMFTLEQLNNFLNETGDPDIPKIQKEILFNGGNESVILETVRLLNHHCTSNNGKVVFILFKAIRDTINKYYKDLWNKISNNIIWFSTPPIRFEKIPTYLNLLSPYINETVDKRYVELEEFYHGGALKDLNSTLFEHRLYEMQNALSLNEADYTDAIEKCDRRGDLIECLRLNVLDVRVHQMEVINNGFLTVQKETIRQLDLLL